MTARTTSTPRSRKRRDRGASLVEFALLAPVLFSLLLGMITGGLALSAKNSMTNAVREGGRLGATLETDATWAADVRDNVVAVSSGDVDLTEVCVQVIDVGQDPDKLQHSYIGGTCTAAGAPPTPGSANFGCIVKVWARRSADLNALFFSRSLTLDATAVGIYERGETCG